MSKYVAQRDGLLLPIKRQWCSKWY